MVHSFPTRRSSDLIGGDHKVEARPRAAFGELVADAGRGAGDDGEWIYGGLSHE